MNKHQELWQFILARLQRGENVMLLVVAQSSGSSPGRMGYKMAVAQDGELCGSIGGGLMEMNLVEQSRALLTGPQASLPASDGLREQVHRKNSPNSSGMICSGRQTVIFKTLTPNETAKVDAVVCFLGEGDRPLWYISPELFAVGIPECPQEAGPSFERISDTDFYYSEFLGPRGEIHIIGGGHCALALSEVMSRLDFHISIYDDRPELNTVAKNHFADEVSIVASYENIAEYFPKYGQSYVVVMTQGYASDKIVIKQLCDRNFQYIGVLGSKAKMATLMRELEHEGVPADDLDRIRTPIGIPINSRSPEEIAVSIAAEIIAVKNSYELEIATRFRS